MTPSVGLVTMNGAAPDVSSTGLVSPMPRATPRMQAVASPGRAVGSTTHQTVFQRLAPSARLASRRPPGTTRSTTSAALAMIGSIITPIASEAARPDRGQRRHGLHHGAHDAGEPAADFAHEDRGADPERHGDRDRDADLDERA